MTTRRRGGPTRATSPAAYLQQAITESREAQERTAPPPPLDLKSFAMKTARRATEALPNPGICSWCYQPHPGGHLHECPIAACWRAATSAEACPCKACRNEREGNP